MQLLLGLSLASRRFVPRPAIRPLAKYLVDEGVNGPSGIQLESSLGQYLSCPINDNLQCAGTSWTFGIWFRATALAGDMWIASIAGTGLASIFQLFYSGGLVIAQMYVGSSEGPHRNINITTSGQLLWKLAIIKVNVAGTFLLKVNNVASASTAIDPILTAAAPLQIGAKNGANTWNGQVMGAFLIHALTSDDDDTWLYNSRSARTLAEITADRPSLLTNMKGFWQLGDATGGQRLDGINSSHLTPQQDSGTGGKRIVCATEHEDQSGNGHHMTFPADMDDRPMLIDDQQNGLPVFEDTRRTDSDGTSGTTPDLDLSTRTTLTVLQVVRESSAAAGSCFLSNSDGTGILLHTPQVGSGTDSIENASDEAGIITIPPVGTYRLLGFRFLGANSRLFCRSNGSAGSSIPHEATLEGLDTFDVGREDATHHRNGRRGDLIIYSEFLTDEQLSHIEPDILERWNFTAGMPDRVVAPMDAGQAYTAGIVRCSNGNLLAFDTLGLLSATVYQYRSTNDGETWEREEVVTIASTTGTIVNTGPTVLDDGRILLPVTVIPTVGAVRTNLYESLNDGETWSLISTINAAGHTYCQAYGRILEVTVDDVDMLWMSAYGSDGTDTNALLLQSLDGGENWTIRAALAEHGGGLKFSEAAVIHVTGDTYLCHVREDSAAQEVGTIYQTVSTDGGETWSAPEQMWSGVSPMLIDDAGDILSLYTLRQAPIGVVGRRSANAGDDWSDVTYLYKNPSGELFHGYPDAIRKNDPTRLGMVYRDDSSTIKWTHFLASAIT